MNSCQIVAASRVDIGWQYGRSVGFG
jgi:hypothetical protein